MNSSPGMTLFPKVAARVVAAIALVIAANAPAAKTVVLPDGGLFDVEATLPRAPYPYGDTVFAFGVEKRSIGGPFPRTLTSLAVVKFGDYPDPYPDTFWADKGFARIPLWGEEDRFVAYGMDTRGRFLVLATAPDPAQVRADANMLAANDRSYSRRWMLSVTRLSRDGAIDRSFNATGRVVFRLGPFADTSGYVDPLDDTYGNVANDISEGADGTIVVSYFDTRLGRKEMARISTDGVLDPGFRPYANDPFYKEVHASEVAFEVAMEYVNERDQYFLTTDPAEMLAIDRRTVEPIYRTGHSFHALPARSSPESMPVCRFHGRRDPALSSHFFTMQGPECDLLRDPSQGWQLESSDAFRVSAPDPATGRCQGSAVPVYRLLALRPDSAHRFIALDGIAVAMVESRGWIREGYGPGVAFCAAP